ncbi:MAG TPA: TRAM domain-containing protein, partial [Spirochaetia bacterium]|nr:TRAM domain-containing protein [Spirochaetia bacterium]
MSKSLVLRIDSLAFGGDGVGRLEGKVCFVPFAAPGDLLSVRIVGEHAEYLNAEIVELLEGASSRRSPRCRHFGPCGGCHWQHIDYPAQLAAKGTILEEAMRRIGGTKPTILPVRGSTEEFGYRTRARIKILPGRGAGYFARSSNDLVAIEECPILSPELESAAVELGQHYRSRTGAGAAMEAQLSLDEAGRAATHLLGDVSGRVRGRKNEAGFEAYAFHQVNRFVNEELTGGVAEALGRFLPAGARLDIVDLYCGDGNLSLPLAARADSLRGFDDAEESIRSA